MEKKQKQISKQKISTIGMANNNKNCGRMQQTII